MQNDAGVISVPFLCDVAYIFVCCVATAIFVSTPISDHLSSCGCSSLLLMMPKSKNIIRDLNLSSPKGKFLNPAPWQPAVASDYFFPLQVWPAVSGAQALRAASPSLYSELKDESKLDPKVLESIELGEWCYGRFWDCAMMSSSVVSSDDVILWCWS